MVWSLHTDTPSIDTNICIVRQKQEMTQQYYWHGCCCVNVERIKVYGAYQSIIMNRKWSASVSHVFIPSKQLPVLYCWYYNNCDSGCLIPSLRLTCVCSYSHINGTYQYLLCIAIYQCTLCNDIIVSYTFCVYIIWWPYYSATSFLHQGGIMSSHALPAHFSSMVGRLGRHWIWRVFPCVPFFPFLVPPPCVISSFNLCSSSV